MYMLFIIIFIYLFREKYNMEISKISNEDNILLKKMLSDHNNCYILNKWRSQPTLNNKGFLCSFRTCILIEINSFITLNIFL